MDDIRSRVTLEAVTKPRPVEKRHHLFKSSEWDLEEPQAFARIARSPIELALITGVVMRLFRAVVLTHGYVTSTYLAASLVLGSLFLAIGGIKSSTERAISLAAAQSGITSSSDIRARTRRDWMQPSPEWRMA